MESFSLLSDSKCDKTTTSLGKKYVMNMFSTYSVPQSIIFRSCNGVELWMYSK